MCTISGGGIASSQAVVIFLRMRCVGWERACLVECIKEAGSGVGCSTRGGLQAGVMASCALLKEVSSHDEEGVCHVFSRVESAQVGMGFGQRTWLCW